MGFFLPFFRVLRTNLEKKIQLQNLRNEIPRGEIQERLCNTVNP